MGWLQVKVTAISSQVEAIEALLLSSGALSVTLMDAADQPLLEPDPQTHPMWDHAVVMGLYSDSIEQTHISLQLMAAGISADAVDYESLAEQQWETAWMDQYQPMRFGQRLWIYPSHIEPDTNSDSTIIRLDPGLAFGSGTHPTTRLCLEWLDQVELEDQIVIDYGCGSGILAIACALKGASKVYAIDHDDQALQATINNAELNQVADRIIVTSPVDAECEPADILLANILAGPLIELAPKFIDLTKSGGNLVMSGILSSQLTQLKMAYSQLTKLQGHASHQDWIRLVVKKP